MDTHTQARVDAVVKRLTRAPITILERWLVLQLRPGRRATWIEGEPKRFLRSLQKATELTYRQRAWLYDLAWRYRHRLRHHHSQALRNTIWRLAQRYRPISYD